ncbi:40S ribosomal protein S13-2-like [Prunus yedoensis var. nudiflora]|uniref:40S ribosomal protein S13-2-like n=1 Tax=Prunus yedoensis var. nudiflora TaxID=2094558 RepID=A0A314V298_PRUYE|nr:40S ribosomal protein S13-2-like [Prunus yedoensis var. nudiflora]
MGRACPPQLCLKRSSPSWLKVTAPDVEENICKFARKGMTPSQIGVILRDSHGIAQVKSVTGSKILRVLKAHVELVELKPISALSPIKEVKIKE